MKNSCKKLIHVKLIIHVKNFEIQESIFKKLKLTIKLLFYELIHFTTL